MAALFYSDLSKLCGDRLGKCDVPCLFCGPARRAPENRKRKVLRVWHREGFASYRCARCGETGYALADDTKDQPRRCARPAEATSPGAILTPHGTQKARIESALHLWAQAKPLNDTLGFRYFVERRGLLIGGLDLDHVLRWHQDLGAVVALMTDPATNTPTGIHRTFLNPDGTKRERKMLGKQGVVRLSPNADVTQGLGITEGIEDGIAVLLSDWAPVWAATSAAAIERFPVIAGVECLTIFSDADAIGATASKVCVDRWIGAGLDARMTPAEVLRHAA